MQEVLVVVVAIGFGSEGWVEMVVQQAALAAATVGRRRRDENLLVLVVVVVVVVQALRAPPVAAGQQQQRRRQLEAVVESLHVGGWEMILEAESGLASPSIMGFSSTRPYAGALPAGAQAR